MKKLLILPLIVFCLGIVSIPSLWAAGGQGIIISPKRVIFEKGQRLVEVLIANRGNEKQKFRISVVNRAMHESGQLMNADKPAEGEFFAKDILHYSPRQISLEPKQAQKIRIMQRLKNDAPDGEYRSHLLVQEIPKAEEAANAGEEASGEIGINVQAIFGITVPVILRKGDLSADISLSNPKIVKIQGEPYLQVSINRTGTKSVIGTANVFAESQKIGILKNIAIYMSTPMRNVSIKLDPERAKNLSGKTLRVTYGAEDTIEDAPKAEIQYKVP